MLPSRQIWSIRPTTTAPPLASVGLGEDTAREKGLEFRVNCQQTAGWYANRRVNEKAAGFKVLIERQSGRILGAHLLGPQADELINVFALAMRADLTADDLREVVRSEEHTSELQSLMRISYAVFCLKKNKTTHKRP